MATSTVEIVLGGIELEHAAALLVAECDEIALVETESRAARELLEVDPSTTTMTSLPQSVELEAMSLSFEV